MIEFDCIQQRPVDDVSQFEIKILSMTSLDSKSKMEKALKKHLLAGAAALVLSTVGAQAGTSGWALVNARGNAADGLNVTYVRHPDTGRYVVRFSDDVSQCAVSATISGRLDNPGLIIADVPRARPTDVLVSTFRSNGNQPADYRFYVIAQCF